MNPNRGRCRRPRFVFCGKLSTAFNFRGKNFLYFGFGREWVMDAP
jgi:hypothetical protein